MRLRGGVDSFIPLGVVCAVVSLVVIAVVPVRLEHPVALVANLSLVLLLTVCVRRTARLPPLPKPTARFWSSLAQALAVYAVGMAVDLVGALAQVVTGTTVAAFGSQLVYPVAGLFTVYAVFRYPTTARTRGEKITVALDAGIVLLGGASFIWYFVVSRQWTPGASWLDLSATLALPAMVLVTGFAMLKIAFVGAEVLHRATLAWYGASVGLTTLATALPTLGPVTSAVLMLAQLSSLTGAVVQYRASAAGPPRTARRNRRRAFSILPYAASAAAFLLLVVVVEGALSWREWGVLGGVGLLLCFVTVRQLTALRENARLLTDNQALTEQLRRQAWYDELTGLANRTLYGERIKQALQRYREEGIDLAVLLIDLDNFKTVNDSLGHDAGDSLLREMAGRLREEVRAQDTVCRLGGDEFVILLDDVDRAHAVDLAERLVRTVARPVPLAARTVEVGASVGIAFASDAPDDPTEVLRRADVAMYSAKAAGKGRWQSTGSQPFPAPVS